ncbi:hypothetical protein UFOVP1516_37 [uncultured Caudovirales phage]|uniref:Uncharacterized protein n=1 Tax=uncultured Caudovirales phage TaxID=2100421 RepID=A0A6J5PAG1_9CAUD|nr:hypothetical protein UFOVP887_7 [uncultured Caudovirales phage]CAB5226832.1 hypothetical protein UFOVP1516_37 [uncultured Caudovirales phage]
MLLDEIDVEILNYRKARFNEVPGPRVGDFVVMPDGSYERFSHKHYDGLQTTEGGSFYLNDTGKAGFSGGLNPTILNEHLELTKQKKLGNFWFFHHDMARAHNAVYVVVDCDVYKVTAELPKRSINKEFDELVF